MPLLDQLEAIPPVDATQTGSLRRVPAGTRPGPADLLADAWGRRAPEHTPDLERILSLPWREPPAPGGEESQALIELMGRRLRKPAGPCQCAAMGRKCILSLGHAQAWALFEGGIKGGLLGPIGVGQGKTALDVLMPMVLDDCRTVVLLIPPSLVEQLRAEYRLWAQHWRVPSLILRGSAEAIVPGAPAVHVVTYSRLSRAEATALLDALAPDVIIADEAHRLRRMEDAAGAGRVARYLRDKPKTRFFCWSGSLTDKSIKDYGHLSGLALGSHSPLPLDREAVVEWSGAIDPPPIDREAAPIGALVSLCQPGEPVREAFRRRLLGTRGVVATRDPGIGASLYMHARDPGPIPDAVQEAIDLVRAAWIRPDGEELVEAFAVARCVRELSCGFFYRWIFPRGEPRLLIFEWLEARKEWNQEVRSKLGRREPHLDSPLLLARAASRYWDKVELVDEGNDDDVVTPETGPLPTWAAQSWPRWRAIRDQVKPETEAVWIDEWVARDAAEWAQKERGIVWYEHSAFGLRVSELAGLPLHGGGPGAEARILAEDGSRSLIASRRSHGEGRDGLQRKFRRQLVANPPVSKETGGAGLWEQLLGRLHREGQDADEVDTWIYRHTVEMREAFDRARELARYTTDTLGSFQKLLAASCNW